MVLPVGVAVLLIGAPQLMPSLSVSVLRFESSAAAAAAALSRATSDFFFLLVGPVGAMKALEADLLNTENGDIELELFRKVSVQYTLGTMIR